MHRPESLPLTPQQWARISSLLVRKTPKQCKARWYEWLDPSIKKTEWSKEEDEKLLHLAKLMPTQWRTIAPLVGRTATQCLERYQRLLDEAEAREGEELGLAGPGAEAAPSADDVRRLRPGEIDPDPETKPAKPDPIDMDEEEKEMLSEARARLANTQGKKAKRKARERALEEARRLAQLQKRRELRAAGALLRQRKKGKEMDYNVEIPFEKQPARGFYDTSEEAQRTFEPPPKALRGLDTQRRRDEEDAKRKREEGKRAGAQPAAAQDRQHEEALRRLRDAEQVSKRRKLQLPDAQVGERELEQIVKLGHASEATQALVQQEDEAGAPTDALLGEYPVLDRAKQARTAPAAEHTEDAVLREARALRDMTAAQTPLLGEENAPERGASFRPPAAPAATPNPLATPREAPAATPGATPRDSLGINAPGATPRSSVLAGLQALPKPKNDFELVVDGAPEEEEQRPAPSAEDAAVRDARQKAAAAEAQARELARRTQVVQRGLPRPVEVDAGALEQALASLALPGEGAEERRVRALLDAETAALMAHDALVFPLPGSRHAGGARSTLPVVPDAALDAARDAVQRELGAELGFPGAKREALAGLVRASLEGDGGQALDEALARAQRDTAWDADRGAWVPRASVKADAVVRGQAALLEQERAALAQRAAAAAKGEKTLAKLLGGYQARSRMLGTRITDAAGALAEAEVAHAAFERLAAGEVGAAKERTERLGAEVAQLESLERIAQNDYRELDAERTQLRETCEQLQAQLEMRRAEAMLEA